MFRLRAVSASAGFTFVELLIVVSLIALMSLIAVPWFVKIAQRNQLKSAAREIQTTLLAARMRAVRQNVNTSVLVTTAAPAGDRHVLDTIVADPPAPTPTPVPISKFEIPNKNVAFVTLPAGQKVTFAGDGRMVTPGGSATSITFRGVSGATVLNQITITTHANGRVEVITPVAWQ
jgi:prepilin-type N-terminal cleavage/methylation domain-containing protein